MSSFIDELAKASANAAYKTFTDEKPKVEALTQRLAEAWEMHKPRVRARAAVGCVEYEFEVLSDSGFSTSEVESMLPPALQALRSGLNTFVWACHDQYTFRYSIKIKWNREHDKRFQRLKAQDAAVEKQEEQEEAEPAAKKQCTAKKEEEEEKPVDEPLVRYLGGHDVLILTQEDGWVWATVRADLGLPGLMVDWECDREVEGRGGGAHPTVCTKQIDRNHVKDHRLTVKPVNKQHSHEF